VPNNRAGIDWSRQAEPYFDRIAESLERRLLPGLRENLVTKQFLTPHDFEHTLRSVDGAAFGPEPVLTQSAWFRYHNRSPDVDGLFFVGAGTHPGGGVPGVLCSARVLERVVPRPARPVALDKRLQVTGDRLQPAEPVSRTTIPITGPTEETNTMPIPTAAP